MNEPAALPTAPETPATEPAPPATPRVNAKRKMRNYLLDAGLQLRFAGYLVAVAVGISGVLLWRVWSALREATEVLMLENPDVGEKLAHGDRMQMLWLSLALLLVLAALIVFAIVATHRVAGPALVLARTCKNVGEGRLIVPRPLRRGDLLVELADNVTGMVQALRVQEEREKGALDDALSRIRGGRELDAVMKSLEAMAADKAKRLA